MTTLIDSAAPASNYVSTREAAQRLGVAVRTVQLWVESGVLRAWKTAGGHRRIPRQDLEALLAARADTLAAVASPPAPKKHRGAFRVMVVEDDPALQMLFEMTLASWDFPVDVDIADNGFSALLKIGQHAPDLLITDLNMPGMDGFAMIRHLRQHGPWQALPIVVVSALGGREIESRGGLPADIRRFGKPVPFEQLELLIRNAAGAASPPAAGQ
ncbi:MAG TPA: response regulator [Rhodocyclaceae bacterium]|nr:response regulator [Rhodocyclaceae bacterium]